MFYTGVGSRKTPQNVLEYMTRVAEFFEGSGFILRTGDADGADAAFREGCTKKEVYTVKDATEKAEQIASKFHPAWNRCSVFARKLHARNVFQVLGNDMNNPSYFLVCWTPDGCEGHEERSIKTGGTGTAISIASYYWVPVFNLARDSFKFYNFMVEKWFDPVNKIMPIKLRRASIQKEKSGLDITVKSGQGLGKYFAPTWAMVQGIKNNTLSEEEYKIRYGEILNTIPNEVIKNLYHTYKNKTLTLLCYCQDDQFCHTNLLIEYLTCKYPSIFVKV